MSAPALQRNDHSNNSTAQAECCVVPSRLPGTTRETCGPGTAVLLTSWAAQIAVAIILGQTLYFKFTYAPETQVIFRDLGGRPAATAVGLVELLCVVLILVSRTAAVGALVTLGTISGAIFLHLTKLGLVIVDPATGEGDKGLLFGLAVSVAVGSSIVLLIRRREIPFAGKLLV